VRINRKKFDVALARKCWGLVDLAAAMGVTEDSLYQQLKVSSQLRTATVGKIAKALEVPVEEIVV